MELKRARAIADGMADYLGQFCNQVEVAGSVRRGKAEVHDIEVVASPLWNFEVDMFGNYGASTSMLHNRKVFERMGKVLKFGEKYVQVELPEGVNFETWIVTPPAQWAVLLLLRTGPAEFSRWVVTPRAKGGALPNGYRVEGGTIWWNGEEARFGDERDLLEWLGLGWIEPGERKERWNGLAG